MEPRASTARLWVHQQRRLTSSKPSIHVDEDHMPPPASPGPEADVRRHRDGRRIVRLEVSGDVDPAVAPRVEHAIHDVAAERPAVLVVDLRGVSAFESASLVRVLDALQAVRRTDLAVAVMPGAITVRSVLQYR
jgi:anti-anti-sigma factor